MIENLKELRAKLNASELASLLKSQGFRRRRDAWNRRRGDIVDVVDFQYTGPAGSSSWGLTVNLGIGFNPVLKLVWEKTDACFISEVDCFPRARILKFANGFERGALDKWWQIDSEESFEKASSEIGKLLLEACFPKMLLVHDARSYEAICDSIAPSYPADEIAKSAAKALMHGVEQMDDLRAKLANNAGWSRKIEAVIEELPDNEA